MYYRNYNNGGNFFWVGMLLFILFGGFRTIFLFIPLIFTLLPVIITGFILLSLFKGITRNFKLGNHVKVGTKQRSRFMELLIHILMKAVQADGKVDQRELEVIKQFFQINLRLNKMDMVWVNDLIQHASKSHLTTESLCEEFTQFDPQAKLILLELIYQVMAADNIISRKENIFIESIVKKLHISAQDHQRIKAHYHQHTSSTEHKHTESHYETLGITKNASLEQIKKAYKDACKKYHPDKVQHLGDEFKKVAEEKIKRINAAYAALKT